MTTTAGRGPYAKGAQRREQILSTALEVFTEGGFHASSCKEIARRVGVTEPTLFHYFGSKQALLAAVLAARDEEHADTASVEGLLDVVRGNVAAPELARLYAVTSAEATDPAHAAHDWFTDRYARLRSRIAAQVAERAPEGVDPEWLGRIVLAAADGLQLQWLLDPDVDMAADLERLMGAVLERDRVATYDTSWE